jgi:hypothetical protein
VAGLGKIPIDRHRVVEAKSTFVSPTVSMLKQNHFEYNEVEVRQAVIVRHQCLHAACSEVTRVLGLWFGPLGGFQRGRRLKFAAGRKSPLGLRTPVDLVGKRRKSVEVGRISFSVGFVIISAFYLLTRRDGRIESGLRADVLFFS